MPYSALIGVPSQSPGVSPVLASHWNDYVKDNFELLRYGHLVFADAAARNAGVTDSPTGMMVYLVDSGALTVLGASGWREAVNTASIVDLAVTTGKIADNAVTQVKMADNSVGTAEIVNDAVTYVKLNNNTKAYSIATSPSVGVYYASNGNLAPDGTSTSSPYLVIADPAANAGTITLTLDDAYLAGYAITGQTITILQKTAGTTNIVAASGTTINGTNTTYVMGGQYSIITLIRIAAATWVITGDFL